MLNHSKSLQWSVEDFDWDSPERPEQGELSHLENLMSDVTWIEYIALPAFSALEQSTSDPEMRQIYRYFQKDEERHSAAECRLMHRWQMLGPGAMPTPSTSIRILQETVQRIAFKLHPSALVAVIPMLELILDSGLIKSLSRSVGDPLFHDVFNHINADEARHLVIDFHALSEYGENAASGASRWLSPVSSALSSDVMYALFFGFMPYLAHMRHSFGDAGLDWQLVRNAMRKYMALGESDPNIGRSPAYQVIKVYTAKIERGDLLLEEILLRLSDFLAKTPVARFMYTN